MGEQKCGSGCSPEFSTCHAVTTAARPRTYPSTKFAKFSLWVSQVRNLVDILEQK